MASRRLDLLLCDARKGDPVLSPFQFILEEGELPTVGLALIRAGVAIGQDDPLLGRKGCFGVFGKVKIGIAPFTLAIVWSCIPPC